VSIGFIDWGAAGVGDVGQKMGPNLGGPRGIGSKTVGQGPARFRAHD
jgi:hypothetical protein